jgi:hypothetical protein
MPDSGQPQEPRSRDPRWSSDPELQYRTDPMFKRVVDMLGAILRSCELTPQEVRAAAMLACVHREMYSRELRFIPRNPIDYTGPYGLGGEQVDR